MKKNKLHLGRTTLQLLSPSATAEVRGGLRNTNTCRFCLPPTKQHSCFDSCYDTDCCLEVP
jgi:hypothetical protein